MFHDFLGKEMYTPGFSDYKNQVDLEQIPQVFNKEDIPKSFPLDDTVENGFAGSDLQDGV